MKRPEYGDIPLIPYIEGAIKPVSPKNISEFLELFTKPIKEIGRALHTEFSGLNLRGVKTHDVLVRRGQPNDFSSIEWGITLERNTIAIVSELTPSEVIEAAGPVLQLFFNQLQIKPEDITNGVIVLKNTNEPITESSCPYDIALIVSQDAYQKGKSGILFKSYGSVVLCPEASRVTDEENDNLLTAISMSSSEDIPSPLIARGIVEAARLVGKAIVSRRIEAGLFK